ncbi:MAG: RDD family protein [Thermoleophilaceae bacterium]|nr:RDD family protein [Thermoleophilaceae bacterium]
MAAPAKPSPALTGPQLDNRRIAAALIDLLIPLAGVAAAYAAGLSLTLGLLLVGVGWTLYYFFALESGDGQTLGKRVMKLRVVSADGTPATMQQIAKRTVVRILDGHIVGLIVMLATGDRRLRLGDIVAGTVVTDAESAATAAEGAGGPARGRTTGSGAQLLPDDRTAPLPDDRAPLVAANGHLSPAPELAPPPPAQPPKRAAAKPPFFKRELSRPSFGRSSKPEPAAVSPAAAGPETNRRSVLKRDLALPSLGRSKKAKDEEAPKPALVASEAKKSSPMKRELSLPSFGRKPRRGAGKDVAALTRTASPGPGATPAPGVPPPLPAFPDSVEPVQNDRLTDALRVAALPEVERFDPTFDRLEHDQARPAAEHDQARPAAEHDQARPAAEHDRIELGGPEPLVAFDRAEPTVELDRPEPLVEFDGPEPAVEYEAFEAWDQADEPDPLFDLGGHEAVVEVDSPEPERESLAELEPWAEQEVQARIAHAAEDEDEGEIEPAEHPEAEAASDHDPGMTIKPIETVSAIDLVMQDAEERRPAGD